MFQQLQILGRLGRDPEMRYTDKGTPVTTFSVAANTYRSDGQGNNIETTVWFRCTAWGRTAEIAAQYLQKGSTAFLVGTLQEPYAYLDKNNNNIPKASMQMTVNQLKLVDRAPQSADRQFTPAGGIPVQMPEPQFDHVPWAQ